MALRKLLPFLGLNINGDVGGLTVYTRHDGRLVAFPAAPPLKPASVHQLAQRQRFRLAQNAWKNLPKEAQQDYQEACNRLSLCMVGHNLWITLCYQPSENLWRTIIAQSCLPLSQPLHV